MIVNFSLVNEMFRGFHIQRWNDRLRPMELIELDKHAHKMIIAYVLGKYEEARGNVVNWELLIRDGIYELLRRIIISDIKSPIFREIKRHAEVYAKLNQFIFKELEPKIEDAIIKEELRKYLLEENSDEQSPEDKLTCRILNAAHIYASYWEFQIVRYANPNNYQNVKIESDLMHDINNYSDLDGIKKIISRHTITNFIDLCGQLRFQVRWAQTPRVPKTSVLGHSMLVAAISYFFTRDLPNCPKRIYNNFFGGLFHDLPEAVTRDIISPVKKSSREFDELISDLEQTLAEQEIYPHVEQSWIKELKYFTHDEFSNKIVQKNKIKSQLTIDAISELYNSDEFSPIDGELVRAADHLSTFLEAWNSINNGIKSEELTSAAQKLSDMYKYKSIGKIPLKTLYSSFKL